MDDKWPDGVPRLDGFRTGTGAVNWVAWLAAVNALVDEQMRAEESAADEGAAPSGGGTGPLG